MRLVDGAGAQRDEVLGDAAVGKRGEDGVVIHEQVTEVAERRFLLRGELEDEVRRWKLLAQRQLRQEVDVACVGGGRRYRRYAGEYHQRHHDPAHQLSHKCHHCQNKLPGTAFVQISGWPDPNWVTAQCVREIDFTHSRRTYSLELKLMGSDR